MKIYLSGRSSRNGVGRHEVQRYVDGEVRWRFLRRSPAYSRPSEEGYLEMYPGGERIYDFVRNGKQGEMRCGGEVVAGFEYGRMFYGFSREVTFRMGEVEMLVHLRPRPRSFLSYTLRCIVLLDGVSYGEVVISGGGGRPLGSDALWQAWEKEHGLPPQLLAFILLYLGSMYY